MSIRNNILLFIAILTFILSAFWIAWTYASLPVVQFSNTDGKCYRVNYAEPRYTCDNLPKKYIPEWVK
jgi:hypothetical protein